MGGWRDGWVDGGMDGGMVGGMDGGMEGWMPDQQNLSTNSEQKLTPFKPPDNQCGGTWCWWPSSWHPCSHCPTPMVRTVMGNFDRRLTAV